MKNITQTLLIAAAMVAFSMSTKAQESSASVGTSAEIITPIAIQAGQSLNFGSIVGTATGGTVTVAPDNARSSDAADLLINGNQTGAVSAASFTVTGQADYTYSITLPTGFNVSTSTEVGAPTMAVGSFVSVPDKTGSLTGGTQTVTVGATLSVGASQAAGAYTHADGLQVTVQYN